MGDMVIPYSTNRVRLERPNKSRMNDFITHIEMFKNVVVVGLTNSLQNILHMFTAYSLQILTYCNGGDSNGTLFDFYAFPHLILYSGGLLAVCHAKTCLIS